MRVISVYNSVNESAIWQTGGTAISFKTDQEGWKSRGERSSQPPGHTRGFVKGRENAPIRAILTAEKRRERERRGKG